LIRNKKYWNSSNLAPKDPVVFNFCTQANIEKAVEKAERRIKREKKELEKKDHQIKN